MAKMGVFLQPLHEDLQQEEELEEHEEELSEEEQLDEWEEEEHQSLTESATDSSFVTATIFTAAGPPRTLSPGTPPEGPQICTPGVVWSIT
jgi:hypothetical protein